MWQKGIRYIAGIDEAGRGPWAGPVVAAAIIWPEGVYVEGLKDSKKLSPKKRKDFYKIIKEEALSYGLGIVKAEEIDNFNILQATFKAMREALTRLSPRPQFLLIDGNHRLPETDIPQLALVKGDSLSLSISAASILAKVTRDEIMMGLEDKFPQYGFSRHKGYGTIRHEQALRRFGPSAQHRFSFQPVAESCRQFSRKLLGRKGEEMASRFLEEKGYKVIGRNIRTRFGEIDIVAKDKETIAFIEVKTRRSDTFGRGEEAISLLKQRRMAKVAVQFMKNYPDNDFRFDVLAAFSKGEEKWHLELITNAF